MRALLYATALAALATATQAAETGAPAPDAATALSELIITASRSPRPSDQVTQSVTVIDAEAIRQSQVVLVADLLATTPGLSVSRNGGPGGVTSLRIRGAEADHTVVLVDGIRLNDPSQPAGGYNFANLVAGDVERIEVLRGPQSTLWGSQAIGGVVNILTADARGPLDGNASAEAGSMATRTLRAGLGGHQGTVSWRIAASHHETDGVSAFRGGAETDGYKNDGASGRLRADLTSNLSLDLRAIYSRGRTGFDGFPAPAFSFADTSEYGTTTDRLAYAGLNLALLDGAWKNRLGVTEAATDTRLYNPARTAVPLTFDGRGRTRRVEYQGSYAISPDWTATFGLDSERASMNTRSPSPFAPNPVPSRAKVTLNGLYGQIEGQPVAGLTVTAGLRRDDHEVFADHTLGQVSAVWSLNAGRTLVRAGFGQGFKAPTLYQLYSTYGNLGLAPETAEGLEFGLEQTLADNRLTLTAAAFSRQTENQIDFVSCSFVSSDPLCRVKGVGRFGYYDNIARARAQGIELSAEARLAPLTLEANYTLTDTQNDSAASPNRGKDLPRRARHQANISASYGFENGASVAASLRYSGKAWDNAANSAALKAYSLVDLRAALPLDEHFEVYGRVENLFDRAWETTRGYGAPGRAAYLGLRAKF